MLFYQTFHVSFDFSELIAPGRGGYRIKVDGRTLTLPSRWSRGPPHGLGASLISIISTTINFKKFRMVKENWDSPP